MLALFWGIGPAFVGYLVFMDWWGNRGQWHVPFSEMDDSLEPRDPQ